jgi:hypothetical protein
MNALLGSLGMTTAAAGASVTPSWGVGCNRDAGNILRCMVTGVGHSNLPATPAGWTVVNAVSYGSPAYNSVTLLTRVAAGVDVAPTIVGIAGVTWTVVLSEYAADPAPLTAQQELSVAVGQAVNTGDQVALYPQPSVVKTVQPDGSIS